LALANTMFKQHPKRLYTWTSMINLSTKFEVSISTHYEDTKGDTK